VAFVAATVSGCGSSPYERVAAAHARYEKAYFAAAAERTDRIDERPRSIRRAIRPSLRRVIALHPGTPRLHPTTPEVGTPEWQREQADTSRREKEVERAVRSICARC
jgi:hypothetical protein